MLKSDTAQNNKPTIRTIASVAGVSTATVSRALRDDPAVRVKTRETIRKLANQIGYRPCSIAARLASNQTGMMAVLLPAVNNPLFAAMAESIMTAAKAISHEVLITYGGTTVQSECHALQTLAETHADGYIVLPMFMEENMSGVLKLLKAKPTHPVVIRVLGCDTSFPCPIDVVAVDFKEGALAATRHITHHGHRDICLLGAGSQPQMDPRFIGFRSGLAEIGIEATSKHIVSCGVSIEHAYRAAQNLFNRWRPTAILAYSDYHSMGIMRAIAERKWRIPEDISLMAFDGIELLEYGYVPITTMAQPLFDIGSAMVNRLYERLKKSNQLAIRKVFSLNLIERGSVAAPPANIRS